MRDGDDRHAGNRLDQSRLRFPSGMDRLLNLAGSRLNDCDLHRRRNVGYLLGRLPGSPAELRKGVCHWQRNRSASRSKQACCTRQNAAVSCDHFLLSLAPPRSSRLSLALVACIDKAIAGCDVPKTSVPGYRARPTHRSGVSGTFNDLSSLLNRINAAKRAASEGSALRTSFRSEFLAKFAALRCSSVVLSLRAMPFAKSSISAASPRAACPARLRLPVISPTASFHCTGCFYVRSRGHADVK